MLIIDDLHASTEQNPTRRHPRSCFLYLSIPSIWRDQRVWSDWSIVIHSSNSWEQSRVSANEQSVHFQASSVPCLAFGSVRFVRLRTHRHIQNENSPSCSAVEFQYIMFSLSTSKNTARFICTPLLDWISFHLVYLFIWNSWAWTHFRRCCLFFCCDSYQTQKTTILFINCKSWNSRLPCSRYYWLVLQSKPKTSKHRPFSCKIPRTRSVWLEKPLSDAPLIRSFMSLERKVWNKNTTTNMRCSSFRMYPFVLFSRNHAFYYSFYSSSHQSCTIAPIWISSSLWWWYPLDALQHTQQPTHTNHGNLLMFSPSFALWCSTHLYLHSLSIYATIIVEQPSPHSSLLLLY